MVKQTKNKKMDTVSPEEFRALVGMFEDLKESYLRLIKHLVARRMFPQVDLDEVLEPIGGEMKTTNPGLNQYGENEK